MLLREYKYVFRRIIDNSIGIDGWKTNEIYSSELIKGVDIHNNFNDDASMTIAKNDDLYPQYHKLENLKKELKRIFYFFLSRYNTCDKYNLLENVSIDFSNDLRFVVHDLFDDLWNETNRYNWYNIMTIKSSGRSDNIRLIAKGVFDKLWEKHKSA